MDDEELVSITGGPLRPHEYILVIPELTAGDEAWIQNHSAKMIGDRANPRDVEITLTLGDVQLATLKRVIRGWNITRTRKLPDGTMTEVPLPFSTANVEKLPKRVYQYALRKFAEMNPDEEESEEDFLPVVEVSSEDGFQMTKVVRLKP